MTVQNTCKCTRASILEILERFAFDLESPRSDVLWRAYGYFDLYPPPNERALPSMILSYDDVCMADKKMFLPMTPTEDWVVFPLVSFQSERNWQKLSIYVLLATMDGCSGLQSITLRFESPEGIDDAGIQKSKHGFFHSQFCHTLNGVRKYVSPPWLPDSQPSMPLDAVDNMDLVLCMLVSLYGSKKVKLMLPEERFAKYMVRIRALKDTNV